jgi:SAM-dependent methyltransferase
MPLDLESLPALERRDPGIWFARRQAKVSYPALGNAACLTLEDRSFWFRHRNRCIASVVRRFPPDDVFLDIGGGNGFVAKGLAAAGFACAIVEPGVDGALAAHARGIDPVICARLEDLQSSVANISAAGMFDVLEHIENEAAALQQVHALLCSGGRLFLTVPAYQFLFSVDDAIAGHFRRYTISSLARTLERSGFKVEFSTYFFAPLPPIVLLLRTAPSKLGLRRGADSDRDATEHIPTGVAARVMDNLLAFEFERIEAGRPIPFGGSCLCVARKA